MLPNQGLTIHEQALNTSLQRDNPLYLLWDIDNYRYRKKPVQNIIMVKTMMGIIKNTVKTKANLSCQIR